jgi:hypothetical protein
MSDTFCDGLTLVAGLLHLAPFAAAFAYARAERQHRAAWTKVPLPPAVIDHSAYRSGGAVVTGHLERAPVFVRLAAASSLIFGAMFVPGVVWGIFGLVAWGIGLSSIPGLVIAAMLWRAGHAMLRGDRDAAALARSAATASLWLNSLIVSGAVIVSAAFPDGDVWIMTGGVSFYALLSIGQALVLRSAAAELEDLPAAA